MQVFPSSRSACTIDAVTASIQAELRLGCKEASDPATILYCDLLRDIVMHARGTSGTLTQVCRAATPNASQYAVHNMATRLSTPGDESRQMRLTSKATVQPACVAGKLPKDNCLSTLLASLTARSSVVSEKHSHRRVAAH